MGLGVKQKLEDPILNILRRVCSEVICLSALLLAAPVLVTGFIITPSASRLYKGVAALRLLPPMAHLQKGMWRRSMKLGFAGTLVAAACCNALLPIRVDSFAIPPLSHALPPPGAGGVAAAPGVFTRTHRDAARLHIGLRLRGGECTPPPPNAGAVLQAQVAVSGEGDACAPRLFAVEGLIGAGKSTLLAKLRGQEGVAIIPEPLERWQVDILKRFLFN